MEAFIIFGGFALLVILLLSPFIVGTISTIYVLKKEDPENFNWEAIREANFPFIIKLHDKIKSKRKLSVSEKLANEYPAVYEFVYNYGCKVTKFDTVIAIDERKQKWVCVNDPDLYVWDFSDIDDAELIEEEKRFYILIHTKRITFPKMRIESYDRASAERLLNTVTNMRDSAKIK